MDFDIVEVKKCSAGHKGSVGTIKYVLQIKRVNVNVNFG